MRKLILLALVGLAAQLVDGSLGMGYGVTSATLLVAGGLGPAAASAAIHFAEIGTTLVSGASHQALGNVDWRTVSILAAPGFVGAFAGATFLVSLDTEVSRVLVAVILLVLGGYVTWRFLGPAAAAVQGPPVGTIPRAGRPGRRRARRGRRRRLGPGRHHLDALLGPAGAAQGGRLGRHRRVRRHHRRLARLPRRPRSARASTGTSPPRSWSAAWSPRRSRRSWCATCPRASSASPPAG